jgi:hypothetical protein
LRNLGSGSAKPGDFISIRPHQSECGVYLCRGFSQPHLPAGRLGSAGARSNLRYVLLDSASRDAQCWAGDLVVEEGGDGNL